MKRISSVLFATALSALLFAGCAKDDMSAVFDARFYTTQANGKLFLYIDDVYKGELPYFAQAPACGQTYSDGQNPISTQLPSGEYKLAGKDARGRVISTGIMKISKNKMSVSGSHGGLSLDNHGGCLAVGIYE